MTGGQHMGMVVKMAVVVKLMIAVVCVQMMAIIRLVRMMIVLDLDQGVSVERGQYLGQGGWRSVGLCGGARRNQVRDCT